MFAKKFLLKLENAKNRHFIAASLLISGSFMLIATEQLQGYEHHLSCPHETTEELAEILVTKFWKSVQHKHVKAYSNLIAKEFQGLNIDGYYNREDQISGLKDLTVKSFKIKKLLANRYDETLVISYNFHARGNGVTSGPSLDIWHKRSREWKLISHAYVPFQAENVSSRGSE